MPDEVVTVPVESFIHPLHLRSFFPFGKFEHLEVAVHVACRYALDYPFYTEVGHALPLLTEVTIWMGRFCMHDSFPTICPLAPSALHRPDLMKLGGLRFCSGTRVTGSQGTTP